ncbi:hypothetical protein Pla52o_54760 [Novipirellula galeiformis]|uniref:Fimbrial assembly protein (PilN) n=1 Tax=Novipirellula galeiformis TaxID=2528004 RepID=A0A5C6BZK9_9BACT|nr:hypothetical protein [Novipirellula galeiformis]TWU17137.1 hypothetical protein Pla52o_54760 [Novipirellula galeiformis]
MNVTDKIFQLRKRGTRSKASGRVAVVHWDRETIDYLVVSPKTKQLSAQDTGRVERGDHDNPLLALSEHFEEHSIRAQGLIVLLSRPMLDQLMLTLPPAEESEIPALVAAEVEQQLGESDEAPIVDYHLLPSLVAEETTTSNQVLAFSLSAAALDLLQTQSSEAGFRLTAIGARDLSPLGILRRRKISDDSLTVSVHLYASEVELAICRGAEPIFLRLIRVSVEDPQRVAEQIWMETQRCLTLLPSETAGLPQGWFVFTTCEAAWAVAQALEDRGLAMQPVDPLIGWELNGKASIASSTDKEKATATYASAANAGAAWEFLNGVLPVNLLSPKRAPVPPNPLVRWGAIGAAAACLIGLGVYFMLADLRQLSTEVASMENDLADSKKLAAKFQEKADQVTFVEGWLTDQVDWLSELNELSRRLPDGQNATVRRLTASANGKQAVIDLSVQVAEQGNISQLEGQIRSAKYAATSKRISQNPDSKEYPWQFETHVTFAVEPADPSVYVAAPQAPAEPSKVGAAEVATAEAPDVEAPNAEVPDAVMAEPSQPDTAAPADSAGQDKPDANSAPPKNATPNSVPVNNAPQEGSE